MPRPSTGWVGLGHNADRPLAVPLDVAAQVLGRPLHELERLDVEPYTHGDGSPRWSLRELAKALGLPVGPANPNQRHKRRKAA